MNIMITGGASGIGLAISKALLADGHKVLVCYHRSAESAKALEERYPNAAIFEADVANTRDLDYLFAYAAKLFDGGADVLINNAGVSVVDCFQNVSDEDFDRLMAVNFGAVYKACARAVPHMLAQKKGNIINISSIWGVHGASTEALYSASKAAVIALTEALSSELGRSGIRVNCIAPGVIDTAMNAHLPAEEIEALRQATPLERIGTGEDIAGAVKFLISENASFITGQTLTVDGGFLYG